MKREIVGQGAAVVLVVAVVAAVVGGAIGYLLKPEAKVPPDVAELQAQIDELNDTISDKDATIADKMAKISDLDATIDDLEDQLAGKPSAKIALITHSGTGNTFWVTQMEKAEATVDALGLEGFYYYSDEDFGKQADRIRELTALDYDIIITTIEDAEIFDAPIQEAVDAGITVIAWGDDDWWTPNPRLAFVGWSGEYHRGAYAGQLLAEFVPEGGKVCFVIPSLAGAFLEQPVGFKDKLTELGVIDKYDIYELEVTEDLDTGIERVASWLSANPDAKAIMSASSMPIIQASAAAKQLGYAPGDVVICGHITSKVTLDYFEEGYVTAGVTTPSTWVGPMCVNIAYALYSGVMPAPLEPRLVFPDTFLRTKDDIPLAKKIIGIE